MSTTPESYRVEFAQQKSVLVRANQTLLEAALTTGIPMLHLCQGNARCSTCRLLVHAGADVLSTPTAAERQLAGQMHLSPAIRLACQTRPIGEGAKVTPILRDQTDIDLYLSPLAVDKSQDMGMEKELVLLFLDIRNFTRLVETHLAFDVIHLVRKLFTAFQFILQGFGGKIIESAGDSLYIVFGLEQTLIASASAAVQAGYAIQSELNRLNDQYFQTYFDLSISIGIGIHQGTVISGTIYLGEQKHLVVMGHAVNVASRLQNATKEVNNDYIVSADVMDLLPPQSTTAVEPITIQVRGISEPIPVYLLGKPYPSSKVPLAPTYVSQDNIP
ncbi:adenylate/guanylate cyclase domain-containing protein [Spirosoma endbachense]|uniref:2Fe-2S iron-sulfur cluster binding domain-containing protein n=1 Tax=Spirosoma endbachense TaxID=2666025 RepID=A0A6P1W424_9BACT|nr:adenylate/guanylate cyclase domain-containing protein [Spirosoma endbachense]QHW00164.1 2Fe-2S iron-sulfur cluster binding domain-containing protein [Spirosoma endbachense]